MDWLRAHWKRLRVLFRKEAVERELDEEMRFHVQMEADKYIREGMPANEAWREAMIAFGGVERFKEEVREVRWGRWFEDAAQDVRYAMRTLAGRRGFTATAVLTLGLGVGATTAMFGVVDALFLSPPPGVRDAGDLVRLYIVRDEGSITTGPGGGRGSYPDFLALRENARGFDDVAAFASPLQVDLDLGPDAQRITGQVVTENFFELLGVLPQHGRFFGTADAAAAASPVVVIAHGFWRRYFGGARDAVGRTLLLNGRTATVVGVAPEGFGGIDPQPVDVWVPAAKAAALGVRGEGWRTRALSIVIGYVGRLAAGAPVELAETSAEAALRHAAEQVPELDQDPGVIAGPFITARGPKRSEPATVALWVALASGLLLLIACANVANLLLARAVTRRREIAVRLSLGVSRGRLLRQLLTESVCLALLGCAAGVAFAFVGAELIRQFPLTSSAARLNGRTLAFAGAAALVTGVLFGLAPAWQALRIDAVAGLKDAARTHPRGSGHLRGALVAVQAAFALVVLTGAGLFLRSLQGALAIDPGVDINRVAMITVDLDNVGYAAPEREAFLARARERLLAMPGVEGVTSARVTPLSGSGYMSGIDPPGPDTHIVGDRSYVNWVAPGFTRTMGMELVEGRALTEADREDTPPVALVSADLARLLVPDGDAVGRCVAIGGQRRDGGCTRIVGVVGTVRHVLLGDPTPYVFLPWTQHPDEAAWGPPRLYARTSGDPRALVPEIRAAVQGLAPDLPFVSVEPMTDVVRDDLLPLRIGATLSSLFGALALGLAAVGLYGVLGYFVAERTPEIGIRRSLGAEDGDVVRLVVRRGLVPVAIGMTLGLAAALAGTKLLDALLFGVSARDPVTFASVLAFLGVVALLASYLPARRATRVDPRLALMEE